MAQIAQCTDGHGRDMEVGTDYGRDILVRIHPGAGTVGQMAQTVHLTAEQALVMAKALEMGARRVRDAK